MLLAFQLSLPAVLIAFATGVQHRFGERVGGLVAGLPLTTLPIVALVALAHGDRFAARASSADLAGVVAQAVMLWVLARSLRRHRPPTALALSLGVFAAAVAALDVLPALPAFLAAGAATAALGAVAHCWPPAGAPGGPAPRRERRRERRRGGDLGLRMALGAAFTLALVETSGGLGAHLSGLVSALPVLSTTMAVLTAGSDGGPAAAELLRGVTAGSFATVAALVVLSLVLPEGHLVAALCAAAGAALLTQAVIETAGASRAAPSLRRVRAGLG